MDLDLREIGNYHRCMIVMGLVPCSTKKLQQRLQKVYNIFLLLSFVGISAYGVHDVHKSLDVENDLMISLSVMTICFISDISTLVVILLEMIIMYDQHVEFINKSHQIYMKFYHKTGQKICSGAFEAWMRRKYGCVGAVLGGGILIYMLVACFKHYYGFFWYSMMIILIIRARFLQMSLYIDIMYNYLQVLNKQLQQIVSVKLNKSLLLLHIDCSVVESLQRLLILKEIYTDIAQSVELYNEIFGWSMISVVVCNYLGITVHVYWFFMTLDGFYEQHFLSLALTMLIALTTIMIVFGYNCEQLQRSHCKTTSLVKKLIGTTNPEYKAVAYEFSLQIYSRPLHVSAKGFFEADMGMLMALGAYIASMMVILVQFSLAEFADRGYRSRNNMNN